MKVEKYETAAGNKGLIIYIKSSHNKNFNPFFVLDDEIDRMYEILHEKD